MDSAERLAAIRERVERLGLGAWTPVITVTDGDGRERGHFCAEVGGGFLELYVQAREPAGSDKVGPWLRSLLTLTSEDVPYLIAEIERLRRPRQSSLSEGEWIDAMRRTLIKTEAERDALQADIERLRAALEHYANDDTWAQLHNMDRGTEQGEPFDWYRGDGEGYEVAREALEARS